jgi:glutamine amidotransferase
MIKIINIGSGNVQSVANAFAALKIQAQITTDRSEMQTASRLVLPGVGNFGYVMEQLIKENLDSMILQWIKQGKPFLGICVGLQVLFEGSEESPDITGLEVITGQVIKFKANKIPQIGWNKVIPKNTDLLETGYAYFVNSYYSKPKERNIIIAESEYNSIFPAAIQFRNVTAVQFHPEKSGLYGLRFLKRWAKC